MNATLFLDKSKPPTRAQAVAAVHASRLPAALLPELLNARRYAEGRGLRLEVRSRRALAQAKILLDIKRHT